jgi:hypothetical protein
MQETRKRFFFRRSLEIPRGAMKQEYDQLSGALGGDLE